MPTWFSLFFLYLLTSVQAAFLGRTCDTSQRLCVDRTSSGSVCLASAISSSYWTCAAPFALPLQTHLTQNYSIAYYNASGRFLGASNYSIPLQLLEPTYVCISARVNVTTEQYYTLCAEVLRDNQWSAGGCQVNVVPPNVVDGCYAPVRVLHSWYLFPWTYVFPKAPYHDDDHFNLSDWYEMS
jgi:hypothetical protein